MTQQMVVDAVLNQIAKDVAIGNFADIETMLMQCPKDAMLAYLPEQGTDMYDNHPFFLSTSVLYQS